MSIRNDQLGRIQQQFRRQALAYERLASVTDAAALGRLVAVSDARANDRVLDVACGPAFLTMTFAERCAAVVGVDGTDVFLDHARALARERGLENLRFVLGDVARLPLAGESFDVCSCRAAFHHFPRPDVVLREMVRVTRPGGKLAILEFSQPRGWLIGRLYRFYFRWILPLIGQTISRSKDNAYRYLPASVLEFPDGDALARRLESHGLCDVRWHPLTFGIATLYVGTKP